MHLEILRNLMSGRRVVRDTWERLLRLERTTSPLAHPDALVHLVDPTLDEIFRHLLLRTPRVEPTRAPTPYCPCGRNPLLAFYYAGKQALREALVRTEAGLPGLTGPARDEALNSLDEVFDQIARREIESFCAVCQFRTRGHPEPAEAAGKHGPHGHKH